MKKKEKILSRDPRSWICLLFYLCMLAAFIVSAVVLLRLYMDFHQSISEYERAREIAGIPDMNDLVDALEPAETSPNMESQETMPPGVAQDSDTIKTPETENNPETSKEIQSVPVNGKYDEDTLREIVGERLGAADISALKEINPDVIGWIYIEATDISYPILYSDNNDKYIRSSWTGSGTYLTAGAIFVDEDNSPDFSDFNTIIYGHRMRNETMFGKLKYYADKEFCKSHPSVYIVTESGISRYDIYSVYEIDTEAMTFRTGFGNDTGKQEYINFSLSSALYDTGIVPTVDEHILTLSTCSGNGYTTRWIIQAVKKD